jgi:hypothetical protein
MNMTVDETIEFIWTLEKGDAEERQQQVQQAGATAQKIEVEESRQLLPFLVPALPVVMPLLPTVLPFVAPIILAGTVSIATLARIATGLMDRERRGLILDVRGGTLDIQENKGIPFGTVISITSDSVKKIELRDDPRFNIDALATLAKEALAREGGANTDGGSG